MDYNENDNEKEFFQNEYIRELSDYLFLDSRRYEADMRGDA